MGSSPIQQATAPVTLEVFREHLERVSSRSVGSIPTWGTKPVRSTGHNSIFYVPFTLPRGYRRSSLGLLRFVRHDLYSVH